VAPAARAAIERAPTRIGSLCLLERTKSDTECSRQCRAVAPLLGELFYTEPLFSGLVLAKAASQLLDTFKIENLKAAMDLYFCFYNFVRFHRTIRATPAMEAGVARSALTVADLVDMAA